MQAIRLSPKAEKVPTNRSPKTRKVKTCPTRQYTHENQPNNQTSQRRLRPELPKDRAKKSTYLQHKQVPDNYCHGK